MPGMTLANAQTLGNPEAVAQAQAQNPQNIGSIEALIAQGQRQQELAAMLMKSGYVPNSGALGAFAQMFAAGRGRKLDKKAGETVAEAMARKFAEENRQAQARAAAEEADTLRKRGWQVEDRNYTAENKLPSYVPTDQGPMVNTPNGLVPAQYASQGGGGGGGSSSVKVPPMQMASLLSKFGGQMTSGYRSPAKNAKVRGVANSQHMQGTGQDWVFPAQVKAQAKAFAESQGYEVIDEGDHLHFELPHGSGGGGGGQGGPIRGPGYSDKQAANARAEEQLQLSRQAALRAERGNAPAGQRFTASGDLENIPGAILPSQNKPPTESERGAAGYLDRMTNAERELQAVTSSGYDAGNMRDKMTAGNGILNYAASDQGQQYRQQQEDWVRSKLRKESGAVIGDDEMEREIKTYFPQPGDKDTVIANKKKSRDIAINAMRISAGRAVGNEAPTAGQGKGYTVGQIIEHGGKRYRVTGGDPADPDVEEVR